MSLKQYLVNNSISFFPPTRFYPLKAKMLKLCGIEVSGSARVVSSANFWGEGLIQIGEETFIGHEVLVVTGGAPIIIGAMVDIAPRVMLVNGSHVIDVESLRSAGKGYSKEIVIEDGVWIGCGSIILGGSKIGRKSVIGAGSLVKGEIPPGVLAVGVPCRPVRCLDRPIGD